MKRKSKKRLKSIISTILSFLLAVLFTVGSVVCGIYVGFLSESRIVDALNYKDYYASVEATFYENAKDLTMPIGLPGSTVEGIVSSDTIYNDVKGYVVNSIQGKEYEFSTDELKSNLEKNVRAYFESQGLTMTSEQEATIPEYTQMIADDYQETLKFPFVQYFAKAKELMKKITIAVSVVCVVLSVVIIWLLLGMQRWKHRSVRYIIYSAIAAAVMTGVPGIVSFATGFYKRINISTEYLYHAVTKYISNGIWVFIYFAIAWIAVAACLLVLIKFLKNNSK